MNTNNSEGDFGKHIEFKKRKRFGIITLSRTERSNALTIAFLENIKKAVQYCQKNKKIRGVLLTHNGSSFSTGIDIDYIDGSDHQAVKHLEQTAADICQLLYNGKPAICAVDGRAMGEGVVFLSCCDYRIATKTSYFQMPEIFSGIFPGTGCTILFSKILGINWAKRLLMFAEKVNAEKALDINLVDKLTDSREIMMEEALNKAKFLFTKNQTVLNLTKLCVNNLFDVPFDQAYEIEKKASAWYEHDDKKRFIKEFRKQFQK